MTKSSEGTMAAKEAICKNCGHGRNGHVDKWGGICVGCPCPGFELVNAAESLPAEPEQEPVAPVEAKDKPTNEREQEAANVTPTFGRPTVEQILEEWAEGRTYGKDSHFIREFSKLALVYIASLKAPHPPDQPTQKVAQVAEPKPTPSTPPERMKHYRNGYEQGRFDEKADSLLGEGPYKTTARQPDSFSIPEQTFEEGWNSNQVVVGAFHDDPKVIAELFWNAAKGSK